MRRLSLLLAFVAAVTFLAVLSLGTDVQAQDKGKPAQETKPDGGKAKVDKAKADKEDADKEDANEDEGDEQKVEITLSVSAAAPALKVEKFLKGEPVKEFKPGHVYVVEFWSTWCGPCKASMPHLTDLQKQFKGKATFVSVNVLEDNEYNEDTLKKVEEFVKKNDEKMGYTVAYDGGKKEMEKAYLRAAGQNGIPCAFVVTGDAKIAYIGHPQDKVFEETIKQLIDGKFDMKAAVAAAKEQQAKEEAMRKNQKKIQKLAGEAAELIDDDKIDEGLAKLDEISKLVPDYAPQVEIQKFTILMNAEQYAKAYAAAKKVIEGPLGEDANVLNAIAWAIVDPEADISKPDVDVAMKAAQKAVKLTDGKNAAILDTLARCHWMKGEKDKAIELQTKAVELAAKDDQMTDEMKDGLKSSLAEYKSGGKDAKKEDKADKKAKDEKKPKKDKDEDEDEDSDD